MPTLQEVDDFKVPDMLIPRVAKEHNYHPEIAAGLVREAKRMLYLDTIAGKSMSPSHHVDMAWHEMLMFTAWYQEFCKFLGRFIHHDPTPGPPDGGKMYERTKQVYEELFGQKPNPTYWP